ncbi:hypothetical protein H072_8471 [Dactylellina haptotyla CBS 200.50]|uniref:Clr5 domain-containing protein n=1 Tax=Dactylellina haptotyla (strain CBS 200.50) TaxID=1284197 RepID=S8BEV5_DACHA|nr:hypothetical protein H072_8471 [Dactylellina haptotyla CBS 200.50]
MPSSRAPKRRQARPIPEGEWNKRRENFTKLYVEKKLKLHECMELMESRHKFVATRRQYLQKIQEWGIEKKVKPAEMKVADKMKRFLKREKDQMQGFLLVQETPARISRADTSPPQTAGNSYNITITSGIYASSLRAQEPLIPSPKYLIKGVKIGRDKSIATLRKAMITSQEILIDDSRMHRNPCNPLHPTFELPTWWNIPTPSYAYRIFTPAEGARGLFSSSLCEPPVIESLKDILGSQTASEQTTSRKPENKQEEFSPTLSSSLPETGYCFISAYSEEYKYVTAYSANLDVTSIMLLCDNIRAQKKLESVEGIGRMYPSSTSDWPELSEYLFQQYSHEVGNDEKVSSQEKERCFNVLELVSMLCLGALRSLNHTHVALVPYKTYVNCNHLSLPEEGLYFHQDGICACCGKEVVVHYGKESSSSRLPPCLPLEVSPKSIEALEAIYNKFVIVSELESANTLQRIGSLVSNPFLPQASPSAMPLFYCVNSEQIEDGQIVEVGNTAAKCQWDLGVYRAKRTPDSYGEIGQRKLSSTDGSGCSFNFGTSVPINIGSRTAQTSLDLESVPEFNYEEFMDWFEGNQVQDERYGLWRENY